MSEQKRSPVPRRWFQYSLGELMVAIAFSACAAICAYLARPFWTVGVGVGMVLFGAGVVFRERNSEHHRLFALACIVVLLGAAWLVYFFQAFL